MATGTLGAGGKIMGFAMMDGFGNVIEMILPTKLDAITLALTPFLGLWSGSITEAMLGSNEAMQESAFQFEGHSAEMDDC